MKRPQHTRAGSKAQSPFSATTGRGNVFALAERAARDAGGRCGVCHRQLSRTEPYRVGHREIADACADIRGIGFPPDGVNRLDIMRLRGLGDDTLIAAGECCWQALQIYWVDGRDLPSWARADAA